MKRLLKVFTVLAMVTALPMLAWGSSSQDLMTVYYTPPAYVSIAVPPNVTVEYTGETFPHVSEDFSIDIEYRCGDQMPTPDARVDVTGNTFTTVESATITADDFSLVKQSGGTLGTWVSPVNLIGGMPVVLWNAGAEKSGSDSATYKVSFTPSETFEGGAYSASFLFDIWAND